MKIVLIGPTYPFRGGIAHYTTLLYRHLKKRHTVRFFAFTRQYPKWLYPGRTDKDLSQSPFEESGVEPVLDSLNPITWIKTAKKIIGWNPDAVIIPWWVSFWAPQFYVISYIVKKYSQAKLIFLCHNVVAHESRRIDAILTRIVLKKGDFFIVHSEEDRQNLLAMIPAARVQKSFHPTYDVFQTNGADSEKIRRKFGLVGPVLLFFGFVRKYKGLEYLLEAMPAILKDVSATLLVAGEFWNDKEEYMSLIRKLGIERQVVIVDEYIPNEAVCDYFAAADLVVQPYTSATGSGVVQIAFGFLKPVIATRVGALSEIIDDGETGYLVNPKSSDEIARAAISFFTENNPSRFRESIAKINYRFSWDKMADVIEGFFPPEVDR